jgi:hypothetical protein
MRARSQLVGSLVREIGGGTVITQRPPLMTPVNSPCAVPTAFGSSSLVSWGALFLAGQCGSSRVR